jgi:hypothetical protein
MNNFTEQEINQLAALTKTWAQGDCQIDARKFKKSVLKWAIHFGLLRLVDDRLWTGDSNFDAINCLPPSVIFNILKPALEARTGFTINRAQEWKDLCVYPSGNRFETVRDLQLREQFLLKLDFAGLINFHSAGQIWRIEII